MNLHRPGISIALIILTAALTPLHLPAQARAVKPGVVYATELPVTPGQSDYVTYSVTVPEDAVSMKISILHSRGDLDLFMNYGSEVESYENAEFAGVTEDYNESLFITRFSEVPLKAGVYYFDIAYQRQRLPVWDNRVLTVIPFSFTVELFSETVEAELEPGRPLRAKLSPKEGMFKTFTVDVPEGTKNLRLDLFGSNADIDLLVRRDRYPRDYYDTDYTVETFLTREHLVIGDDSPVPLFPGRYYVTVLDQVAAEYSIDFTIQASFTDRPPRELLRLPPLPFPETALERVLYSTVEISTRSGKGSGCLVSPDGLIVTNWHVIKSFSGDPEEDISVAFTLDPKLPPVELFKARVLGVEQEKDLALLELASGMYGQKVPAGYRFPYVLINLDHEYKIGDDVGNAGYPGIGGTGSRASITYTRGIVSGFEQTDFGTIFKTDGLINSGSSGGAAVDTDYRLIGLPTIIMEESAGQMGFIHPISLFPHEWLETIRRRGGM